MIQTCVLAGNFRHQLLIKLRSKRTILEMFWLKISLAVRPNTADPNDEFTMSQPGSVAPQKTFIIWPEQLQNSLNLPRHTTCFWIIKWLSFVFANSQLAKGKSTILLTFCHWMNHDYILECCSATINVKQQNVSNFVNF